MTSRLELSVLGTLTIKLDGEHIDTFVSRKAEALLVYLACTKRIHAREVVAELLWHERPRRQALANLRVVLSSLRKTVGPHVTITRTSVAFDQESNYQLDLDAFDAGIDARHAALASNEGLSRDDVAQLGAVVSEYDEFMAGFSLRGSQGFDEWVLGQRERLRLRVVDALHRIVDAYLDLGIYADGIPYARRLVALAPLREAAHRQLMQLLAYDGQRNAALVQYAACRQQLADDLGVAPTPETTVLFERIRDGEMQVPVRAPAGSKDSDVPIGPAPCPYQGLDAFSEEDANLFFGREAIVARLLEAVRTQPLVALVGSSGSGKSSVLFAGLVPTLRRVSAESTDTERWCLTSFRPGRRPIYNLATALGDHLEPATARADDMIAARRLADALRSGTLAIADVIQRVLQTQPARSRPILVIDQFEELFTLCGDAETRDAFLTLIATIVASTPCTVVLALRADFMGQALASRSLADLLQDATVHIGPMNRDELHRSIEEPAHQRGVTFEHGLIKRILDDTDAAPGKLPLLEFSLTILWEQQANAHLTHAAYDAIGGVSEALTRYADRVYDELDSDDQHAARHALVQLVHPGDGTEDTRRLATRTELGETNWMLVRRLADARLVVTGRDAAGREVAEVAHEALIRSWGRLRSWIDEDRAFRMWQERLRIALRQWERSDRAPGALLHGIPLSEAEQWTAQRGDELSAAEHEFVQAGLDARNRRRRREEQRRAREVELERRNRQRLRALVVVLALSTLVALALMAFALNQSSAARRAADRSQSLALATSAQVALQDDNTDLALALAQEATRIERPPEQARLTLAEAAYAPGTIRRLVGHEGPVRSVALNPDGHTAITAGDDTSLILWNLDTGEQIRSFVGHEDAVYSVAFGPDGRTALSGSADATLILWDVATGRPIRRLYGHSDTVRSVAFGPNGRTALSGGDDNTVIVWNLDTGKEIRRLSGHTDMIFNVAVSDDGRTALSVSADRSVIMWDIDAGTIIHRLSGHTDWVRDVTFMPDGRHALSASEDTYLILWDLQSGTAVRRFPHETAGLIGLDVSPDGRRVLGTSIDSTLILWDVETGEKLDQFLGHAGIVYDVAYGPDGRTALSASEDGTPRLWRLQSGAELRRLTYESGAASIGVSPDGKTAVTGLANGDISVWNVESGEEIRRLRGHTERVFAGVEFGPEGRTLLSGAGDIFDVSDDNTLRLWDLNTGEELRRLTGHTQHLWDVDISPDGRYALSVARDGTARYWDLETGTEVDHYAEDVILMSTAFSPDGKTALIGTSRQLPGRDAQADYSVRLRDLEHGTEIRRLLGHGGPVIAVAFSPDGRRALSGSLDGVMILWDVETGRELRRFDGHRAGVTSVAFSPDGSMALSGSVDKTMILWDLQEGTMLRRFVGHEDAVTDVAFSPDGRTIFSSGGRDQTVRLWRIDATRRDLLRWIDNNRYTPELSCKQRAQYGLTSLCSS